jgi:hypothetical protein
MNGGEYSFVVQKLIRRLKCMLRVNMGIIKNRSRNPILQSRSTSPGIPNTIRNIETVGRVGGTNLTSSTRLSNYFDIINNQFKSHHAGAMFSRANRMALKALQSHVKGWCSEERAHQGGEVAGEMSRIRSLNRISYQRFEHTMKRGYDILSNSEAPPASPFPKEPLTCYEELRGIDPKRSK